MFLTTPHFNVFILKKKKKKIPETQLSHTVPVLQYLAGEKTECREVAL